MSEKLYIGDLGVILKQQCPPESETAVELFEIWTKFDRGDGGREHELHKVLLSLKRGKHRDMV
jgi:hypothetical protein